MVALEKRLSRPAAVIAYGDTNRGSPAVVLTHGAGLDHTVFTAQIEASIAEGYRVIIWDLRGHGASIMEPGVRFTTDDAMADLAAVLDACGVDQAILVGHSFGGNLSQAFAHVYPDRVAALFMLAATWKTQPLTRFERLALSLTVPLLQLVPARGVHYLMTQSSVSTHALRPATRQLFGRIPKQRLLQVWRSTMPLLDTAPYRHFPAGLIRGASDPVSILSRALPHWAQAEELREYSIDHARHIVSWDAPEAVSKALLEMLARVPASR